MNKKYALVLLEVRHFKKCEIIYAMMPTDGWFGSLLLFFGPKTEADTVTMPLASYF
jgi:hypothetical protein